MEKNLARRVAREFIKQQGPQLSLLEALSMTKVFSDGFEMYAIQKGDVTFLAWVRTGEDYSDSEVICMTVSW